MTDAQIWVAILIAAGVSLLVRALPLTLIRRPIKNRFIRSFLYYVPYVTLAVMTFPAIINETATPVSGAAALLVGIGLAFMGNDLMIVSIACCATVFVTEFILL